MKASLIPSSTTVGGQEQDSAGLGGGPQGGSGGLGGGYESGGRGPQYSGQAVKYLGVDGKEHYYYPDLTTGGQVYQPAGGQEYYPVSSRGQGALGQARLPTYSDQIQAGR